MDDIRELEEYFPALMKELKQGSYKLKMKKEGLEISAPQGGETTLIPTETENDSPTESPSSSSLDPPPQLGTFSRKDSIEETLKQDLAQVSDEEVKEYLRKRAAAKAANFRGYDPNVFDFLARAQTEKEALEVLEFLEKKGELSSEQKQKLERKIRTQGLRAVVPAKKDNYYLENLLE